MNLRNFFRLEDHANEVLTKLDFMDHHVEHELVAVNDHIESMLGKMKKREDVAEGRIDNLEETVRKVLFLYPILSIFSIVHFFLFIIYVFYF